LNDPIIPFVPSTTAIIQPTFQQPIPAPGRRNVQQKSEKPAAIEGRKKTALKNVEEMKWMKGNTIGILVNKIPGHTGSGPFSIDGTKGGYSEIFDVKMQDTGLHNICYLDFMGNCFQSTVLVPLDSPPKDRDWPIGSFNQQQLLLPTECVRHGTFTHDGQQMRVMTERPKTRDDEAPKHYLKYTCSCWNYFMGFTLVHHLEKSFLEQQEIAGIKYPVALNLKTRLISLQNMERILDGDSNQRFNLLEIMTTHIHQLWVGNLKPLRQIGRFIHYLQSLHTKHRIRITPPPTMIQWHMNKLEHNRMLADRNLATWLAEIEVPDTFSGHQTWIHILKEGIDVLVQMGKNHTEAHPSEVPVQLNELYLKRHGVVLKFDYDGLGNVFLIRYASASLTSTRVEETNEASSSLEEDGANPESVLEEHNEEEETPVAEVVVDGPVTVHSLPDMKLICPSLDPQWRHNDNWESFLQNGRVDKKFTWPKTVIVQPYVLTLQESETAMYYSFDQQCKLLPLAEMQFRPTGDVIPVRASKYGGEVTNWRLEKKIKKVWKEKVPDKPYFKEVVGKMITNPPWGIYKQSFLPFRVNCYTDKLYGGNKEFCLVNSLGFFPMVDIQSVDGHDLPATLVMNRYCDWASNVLQGYPMA